MCRASKNCINARPGCAGIDSIYDFGRGCREPDTDNRNFKIMKKTKPITMLDAVAVGLGVTKKALLTAIAAQEAAVPGSVEAWVKSYGYEKALKKGGGNNGTV